MITAERRKELRHRVEVEGEDLNHGILHEMFNAIDELAEDNARLNRVVDQAIPCVHYQLSLQPVAVGDAWLKRQRDLAAELERRQR